MKKVLITILFGFYEILWILVIPFLKNHKRIGEGYDERKLKGIDFKKKDIWIQAASAGESYLVETLLDHADFKRKYNILLTTCTSQGVEILEKVVQKNIGQNMDLEIRYLPFDRPSMMRRAVKGFQPDTMVILETEIWPGLLRALKKEGIKTVIVNGRITEKSVNGYRKAGFLWPIISPTKILATKETDAKHFEELFKTETIVMNNLKFERISDLDDSHDNPLKDIVSDNFLVLGSVRMEEEEKVSSIIDEVLKKCPGTVIGLFPRHMHRLDSWRKILKEMGVIYKLRSEMKKAVAGEVILWDTFGELNLAYGAAKAVFVGGSLVDLGGQNFLEPLMSGVIPVIGPYWDNFLWLGEEISDLELVHILPDEKSVAEKLCCDLSEEKDKKGVIARVKRYLDSKRGGAKTSWESILQ